MPSLRPFDLVTWGVCERRGKTSVTVPPSPMPHNNMGQRAAECAWCSAVATAEDLRGMTAVQPIEQSPNWKGKTIDLQDRDPR